MTKTEKMTYAKALTAVLNGDTMTDEIREKLENLLAQQTKKAGAERKPTKNQRENERLREIILAELTAHSGEHYFYGDIVTKIDACAEFSSSKVSALMRPLVESQAVSKGVENKHVYYFVA